MKRIGRARVFNRMRLAIHASATRARGSHVFRQHGDNVGTLTTGLIELHAHASDFTFGELTIRVAPMQSSIRALVVPALLLIAVAACIEPQPADMVAMQPAMQPTSGAGGAPAIAGASAGMPAVEPEPVEDLRVAPAMLSQTGLFSDVANDVLGAGVQFYEPKYELWSDGAHKRRWVKLPVGTQIDTSDMDNWHYPVGTKIWKEFGRNGQRLETRYMAKYGPEGKDWVFMAYQWGAPLADAGAVPGGVPNAGGTTHDIPDEATCRLCHQGLPEGALGVSAIQLSHDRQGLTLNTLIAGGSLSHPPAAPLTIPGDPVAEQALGYLHANCGGCHNQTFDKSSGLVFWQSASQLAIDKSPGS